LTTNIPRNHGRAACSPDGLSGLHNLRKRSQKMKRQHRGTEIMAEVDARIVRAYMPYGRK